MQQEYLHGGVGCVDAERILLSKRFQPILFPYHNSFSFKAKIGRIFFLVKLLFTIRKNSIVIFLFPLYAKMNRLLVKWLNKKGVQIICYIADIDGIKDGNERLLKKEINFFRQFKYFIVHNARMKEWLYQNVSTGCNAAVIQFFDFLGVSFTGQRYLSFNIVFAGNLDKSSFLEKLYLLGKEESHLYFHLYGPGQTHAMLLPKNVTWHGVEKPYNLPAKLNGSFGLIWEGESIEKPSGSLGHYIQYISHHKLSLYILSKLPIIVAATAASAPLIEKYEIGFTVNSLYEIEDKIKKLSTDEYCQMQINMQPLAEKISKGECLSNAIEEIVKQI